MSRLLTSAAIGPVLDPDGLLARFAAFFTAFLAGFRVAFLTVFVTALLAVFFAGFRLAAFFFTVFFDAFLGDFFAAFLAMTLSSLCPDTPAASAGNVPASLDQPFISLAVLAVTGLAAAAYRA